ncbi:tyrosine-type recombinase/integrase [Salibacteraceae bacterium]|nr:tyrosine-type recombinase/integrase [Salibacteraceae bacterium]HAQ70884.1 integrase [Flavobacteriales bacterium]
MKDLIAKFLDYLSYQKRYSNNTIIAYRNDLNSFADYLEVFFETNDAGVVSRRMISSFIADLAESGISSRSINRKLSSIQSFYGFLLKEGPLEVNPAKSVQRPKTSSHLPSVMRSEQVEQLFEPNRFAANFEGRRDLALLSVFYACGLRRDELINLKVLDIDFHQSQLKVLGKRNKERIIPIAPELIKILRSYIDERGQVNSSEPFLFLTGKAQKMYPSLVYEIVKNYLSKVTTMEKRSPHVLRHTFATHLLNEGANLQSIKDLLGHASLATTQIYTHTSLEKLKDVYNQAHPRSKK